MQPLLPPRCALLLKQHHLHVYCVLRWQPHCAVVAEELLERTYCSERGELITLVGLALGVLAATTCVELPGADEEIREEGGLREGDV